MIPQIDPKICRAALIAGVVVATATAPAATASAQPLSSVAIGAMAPDFTLQGADGKPHRLSDYRGSTVVLEWTSPVCEVTAQYYASGKIPALQRAARDRKTVWLAIDTAAPGKPGYLTAEAAGRLVTKRGATVSAFLFDPTGSVGRQYGAKATPSAYIVSAKGTLVYQGAIAETPGKGANYVQAALDEMAVAKPVTTPSTPQRGCPVEY